MNEYLNHFFINSGYYVDTDPSTPSATVLVACYNHEAYIANCLDGILLQQTNFPFEVIITDDFSTDKSRDIIESYVKEFPNIFKANYLAENTSGRWFKNVFQMFEGKYSFLLDGDDFWIHTKCMQHKVDFLEKNRGIHLCSSVLAVWNVKDNKVEVEEPCNSIKYYTFNDIINSFPVFNLSRNCFRTKTLRTYGELPSNMLGDFPIALLMANKGLVAKLPEVHSVYRITGKGMQSGLSMFESDRSFLKARKYAKDFFSANTKRLPDKVTLFFLTHAVLYLILPGFILEVVRAAYRLFNNLRKTNK